MPEKRRTGPRPRAVLEPYDTLRLQKREDTTSVYEGEKGVYVFERAAEFAVGKPVMRVYLNRQYLTGLFKAKGGEDYSGDIKGIDGKQYLLFRREGEAVRVYLRKPPPARSAVRPG